MSLIVVPSKISKIGIKREALHGVEAAGAYRGLLVTSFESNETGDFEPFQRISGVKGFSVQGNSGSHQEVSFSFVASSSDAAMATLIDILDMMFGADVVTGANPYTHTFRVSTSPSPMPSWTFYQDDGKSNHRVFTGFVPNTLTITIEKETGFIECSVEGFAWEEIDTTLKTVNFTSSVAIYTPRQAAALVGGTVLENFNSIEIEIAQEAEVHNTINDLGTPSQIDGKSLACSVSFEGFWNEGPGQLSDVIRNAFMARSVSFNLIVRFGPSQVNDGFKLTLPRWSITEHSAKNLDPAAPLPQTFVAQAIHEDDAAANGFKVEVFNTISTDWDSL